MVTQKENRVLSVLKRHSGNLCNSSYTDVDGEAERHCVLGWLAVEAGIDLPQADFNTYVLGMEGTLEFGKSLAKEYGLPLESLKRIQFANDDAMDFQEFLERASQILSDSEKSETVTRVA